MTVNFEFLGEEAIENVITCMNFKIDKAVFFGYHDMIEAKKEMTESFLKKYCGVQSVVFHEMSSTDLQSVLKTMRKEIEFEKSQGGDIYFDITGGENLLLVAFGMLTREFKIPMHYYDIPGGKLIEPDVGSSKSISERVEKRKVDMTLDNLIQMHGGTINYNLHKKSKDFNEGEFEEDVRKMWQVNKAYSDHWNLFSEFLRANMKPDENLRASMKTADIKVELASSRNELNNIEEFDRIVDALGEAGVLQDVVHNYSEYSFKYKNEEIQKCLWESGSILELQTYQKETEDSEECRVGVHIDWDGVVHDKPGMDVLNEVDVLSLRGYVPTFISCKDGNLEGKKALNALYEIDTVAKRFGGKYARKVLTITKELSPVYIERAAEMGIEIR